MTPTASAGGARKQASGQRRIDQHAGGRVRCGEHSRQDHVAAVAEHRSDGEEHRGLEDGGPRLGDDKHAGEADGDRGPAARSDPFAEQRTGNAGDDEGAGKVDRYGLGKLKLAQRKEVEDGRGEEEDAAEELNEGAIAAVAGEVAPGAEKEDRRDGVADEADPGDLDRRHVAARIFRERVETGEAEQGEAVDGDAASPRRSFACGQRRARQRGKTSINRWRARR